MGWYTSIYNTTDNPVSVVDNRITGVDNRGGQQGWIKLAAVYSNNESGVPHALAKLAIG